MQMAERAASVRDLTDLDLNYPDHVTEDPAGQARRLGELGLRVNGLAMRYYVDPAFKLGAFTHPDRDVRRKAIDLTKRGIEATREMGASLLTIWPGQDGFDYSFQADYHRLWEDEIGAFREVAAFDSDCAISIEYKPNEPRSFCVFSDLGTTLLAIREIGLPNMGVTLDFAHVLYADEMPAFAAAMIHRHARLLGVHLNDGYAKRDDGLMVGSVHLSATLELLCQILRDGYDGAIYFDTFPDATGLDPVAECTENIATVKRLLAIARAIEAKGEVLATMQAHDAVAAQGIVIRALLGAEHDA